MRTSEFINKVKELGYSVRNEEDVISVHREEGVFMKIYKDVANSIDTLWNDVPSDLFDLGEEYVKTPTKEREDKDDTIRYYLYSEPNDQYFIYGTTCKYWQLGDKHQDVATIQTQFTRAEIDSHQYKQIMELFTLEEVPEDEYIDL